MRLAALALAASLSLGACGFGEGEAGEGEATLTVTRDYGAEELASAVAEDPPATDTVMRFLDREAEIETRYAGGFVQSIDGLAGAATDGRTSDWFFYVDGLESPIGATEVGLDAETRIWWDYHDWTDVMRVPAVVGSFPAPFATQGAQVSCTVKDDVCAGVKVVAEEGAGADAAGADPVKVFVGPWKDIRAEGPAAVLGGPSSQSGVFARFEQNGRATELVLYDETLTERERLGPGSGLVAAVEGNDGEPAWLVTGTDTAGVFAAAALLDTQNLTDRFAVAARGVGDPVPIPVRDP